MLTIILIITMMTMIDNRLFLHCGGGGTGGGGRSIKSYFNIESVNERKLVEMICTQPPLDICSIVKNHCCRCLRCRLLGGGRGLATCITGNHCNGWQWQLQWPLFEQIRGWTRKKESGNRELGWYFFMLSYFVIVFWHNFFNAGRLISAIVAACCRYHHCEKRLVNSITFFYYIL